MGLARRTLRGGMGVGGRSIDHTTCGSMCVIDRKLGRARGTRCEGARARTTSSARRRTSRSPAARPRHGPTGAAASEAVPVEGAADAPRPEADYAAAVACSPQAGAGQGRRAARTVQVQVRKSIDHANHVMSGSEKLS